MVTKAGPNGEIAIPSEIRRHFEIREGTRIYIDIDEENHSIILMPITRTYINSLRENDDITWFWIGSHAEYGQLVSRRLKYEKFYLV